MEHFPHSGPATKTATIKVSLDEYVIATRGKGAELMTDGLSGCVAVALKSGDRIGLTHVYSDALGRFDDYKEPLKAFANKVANGGEITEAYIVHNSNARKLGQAQNLPEMIGGYLAEQGLAKPWAIRELHDNGCAVSDSGLFLKRSDNPDIFANGGHTNSTLAGLAPPLAAHLKPLSSGALFEASEHVRASGYVAPSDLGSASIAPQPNRPDALATPPLPPLAKADASTLPLDKSVRQQLLDSKLYAATATPVARAVTEQLGTNGFTEARLAFEEGGKKITASGNGKTMEFAVEGRSVSLMAPRATELASSSSATVDSRTLFQQAADALGPHRDRLGIKTGDQAIAAAREIASQAHRDGLGGISRLELTMPDGGKPSLVAHQDGSTPKQARPMDIETLQQTAGVTSHAPSHEGPDKHHFQIM
jgi:hypothetical protein